MIDGYLISKQFKDLLDANSDVTTLLEVQPNDSKVLLRNTLPETLMLPVVTISDIVLQNTQSGVRTVSGPFAIDFIIYARLLSDGADDYALIWQILRAIDALVLNYANTSETMRISGVQFQTCDAIKIVQIAEGVFCSQKICTYKGMVFES